MTTIALRMIQNSTNSSAGVFFVTLIIGSCARFGQAEKMSSDANPLVEASRRYRENLDLLVTWMGQVELDHESADDRVIHGKEIHGRELIDFAYHRPSGQYYYFIRDVKNMRVREDVETPRVALGCEGELHRDNLYYYVSFRLRNASGKKAVYVADKPHSLPAFHNGAFLPKYFFQYEGGDLNETLDMYAKHVDDADVDLTVERTGDIITLERFGKVPTKGLVYELDLSKSGMPVRIERMRRDGDVSITQYQWHWQNVSGVWVPLTATRTRIVEGEVSYRKQVQLKWTSTKVNVPLPEDALTLASLHVYRGDKLVDSRTGEFHLLEDQELPVRPARIDTLDDEERDVALGRWLFGIGNVLLLIVLVAAFFWRRGKGRKEA